MGSGQPFILPDPVRAGNVYVVASDDPNNVFGNGDDTNVMIARSTDFGVTSTSAGSITTRSESAVMPTAQIDQDGNIAVTWYDDRRLLQNTGANANFGQPNFLLDLYGTTSRDGGQTFVNDVRISDNPFDPDAGPSTCRFGSRPTNDCTERSANTTASGPSMESATQLDGQHHPPAPPFPSDGSGGQRITFDVFS